MRELLENTKSNGFAFLVALCLILITTLFSILALYSPFSSTITTKVQTIPLYPLLRPQWGNYGNCDLFNGEWVKDSRPPPYTNATCPTIPTSKDCFLHGRIDHEFLYWRWKPQTCELPRFEPKTFFQIMQNKKLAFIGDSIARNQIESLLCLLFQEEGPINMYKDAKDRTRTWYFPRNNVTLIMLWTRFLIKGVEKEGGVFDLHLDQVDENWAYNVSKGMVDYAIVSSSQWFFKKHYLYEGGNLIGCLYCNENNLKEFRVSHAVGIALRTTLRYIDGCKECKDMVTIVITITPSHFEQGTWKTGGHCNRTKPYNKVEAQNLLASTNSKNNEELEVRDKQMEEIVGVKRGGGGKGERKFRALDITRVMLMRPDAHPSEHWRDKKKKGFNDCVHWCMPGPIDVWNHLLLALLVRI